MPTLLEVITEETKYHAKNLEQSRVSFNAIRAAAGLEPSQNLNGDSPDFAKWVPPSRRDGHSAAGATTAASASTETPAATLAKFRALTSTAARSAFLSTHKATLSAALAAETSATGRKVETREVFDGWSPQQKMQFSTSGGQLI